MPPPIHIPLGFAATALAAMTLLACHANSADPDPDTADATPDAPECGVIDGELWGCEDGHTLCSHPDESCLEPKRDCTDAWCRIPAATFVMGPSDFNRNLGDPPRRPVRLTRAFQIQKDETTVSEWVSVMGHDPTPMDYLRDFDHPVFGMSVFDILEYANRRSESDGLEPCYTLEGCEVVESSLDCARATFVGPDCEGYRLPSEAEWELAAGVGTGDCIPGNSFEPMRPSHGPYCSQPPLQNAQVRHCGNAAVTFPGCVNLAAQYGPTCAGPGPVGEFAPNTFGIRGMLGNVFEHTGSLYARWHRGDSGSAPPPLEVDPGFDTLLYDRPDEDPEAPSAVTVRGGSFRETLESTCSYSRAVALFVQASSRRYGGFRLARTVPD